MASGAARPTEAPARSRLAWIALAVSGLVALDQLTKHWAVSTLSDGPVHVIGDTVEFALSRNPGSAFGRFQGMTTVLAVGAILVSVLIVREAYNANDRVKLIGYVLVLGGALGNLSDRFFRDPGFLRGHVVDFVAVGRFPVFNFADSCITIGAILLVWRTLRTSSA
ncbi:MAG: signal peptidase II [Acidimicrobiia bacterium]